MKQVGLPNAALAGLRVRRLTPVQAQVHVFCARNHPLGLPAAAARIERFAGASGSGETRTRTGDTTIFRRAVVSLERRGKRCKFAASSRAGACLQTPQTPWVPCGFGRRGAARLPIGDALTSSGPVAATLVRVCRVVVWAFAGSKGPELSRDDCERAARSVAGRRVQRDDEHRKEPR